jgi:hypothetical protein
MSAGIRKVQAAKAFHLGLRLLHAEDVDSAEHLRELIAAQDADPRHPMPTGAKSTSKRSLSSSSSSVSSTSAASDSSKRSRY